MCADGNPFPYAEIITSTPRLALQLQSMCLGMAIGTKGNQVFFRVVSRMASKPNVVNLQMLHAAAELAAPAVALQHGTVQLAVTLRLEFQSPGLGRWGSHESTRSSPETSLVVVLGRNW